jgi:hypothetical protein
MAYLPAFSDEPHMLTVGRANSAFKRCTNGMSLLIPAFALKTRRLKRRNRTTQKFRN